VQRPASPVTIQQSLGAPQGPVRTLAVDPSINIASLAVRAQRKIDLPCRGVQVALNSDKPPIPRERTGHTWS
jgi:hypothetical protein